MSLNTTSKHENHQDRTLFWERETANARWEEFNNTYETSRRIKIIFERLLKQSEVKDGLFLDAGSGGGHFSRAAENLGAEVVSMDVGINLLKQVSERSTSEKVAGSVTELPIKKDLFDVVLCTDVIEHTPDPLHAIKELCDVTKPGGILVITVPCRLWNPVVNLATALKLRPFEGYENFLWPGNIKDTLEESGFTVERLMGFNFCPLFTKKLDFLFEFFDKAYGNILPWLMVNIGVRARKGSQ